MTDTLDEQATRELRRTFATFCSPRSSARFDALLSGSPQGQRRLVQYLPHFDGWKPQRATPVQGHTVDAVLVEVRAPGNSSCLVLSELEAVNGDRMLLRDAVAELLGQGMASLLVIDPEHLALYLGERHDESLVLRA